jgi:hypothetical protein
MPVPVPIRIDPRVCRVGHARVVRPVRALGYLAVLLLRRVSRTGTVVHPPGRPHPHPGRRLRLPAQPAASSHPGAGALAV